MASVLTNASQDRAFRVHIITGLDALLLICYGLWGQILHFIESSIFKMVPARTVHIVRSVVWAEGGGGVN
ncbi:unnamed protein product [Pieris brassicae]|uniref:Uncharacterized protein n=1 Tax=Pieris brassicae TaxID=7116 RepID=A0A9P0X188_PIEBR|nr:unnamed protein product [Pieris brassicae]